MAPLITTHKLDFLLFLCASMVQEMGCGASQVWKDTVVMLTVTCAIQTDLAPEQCTSVCESHVVGLHGCDCLH